MCQIFKNDVLIYQNDDSVETLKYLNKLLNCDRKWRFNNCKWSYDENVLRLENISKSELFKHFEYLLIPYDIIVQYPDFIRSIKIFDPKSLCDLMFNKYFSDPIELLVKYFNVSINNFYQSFIYYLNRTVIESENSTTNIIDIVSKFSTDFEFKNILLFFFLKKNIYLWKVKHIQYVPHINY